MGKFNKRLLVEGNDDLHVVKALCQKFNINEDFEVVDCKGIDNLTLNIPLRLKESDLESLGIIIDADIDLHARWQQLTNIFSKANIKLPATLEKSGMIVHFEDIKIGIWIMPNNELNGMLEDFISLLVPHDDKLLPIANDILNDIEGKKVNKYISAHRSKAQIHTWLSWQEDPGKPMGQAITRKILDPESELCSQFMQWLTNTFK